MVTGNWHPGKSGKVTGSPRAITSGQASSNASSLESWQRWRLFPRWGGLFCCRSAVLSHFSEALSHHDSSFSPQNAMVRGLVKRQRNQVPLHQFVDDRLFVGLYSSGLRNAGPCVVSRAPDRPGNG